MLDRGRFATSGRYRLSGGEDVQRLGNASATDFIERRRLTVGPVHGTGERVIYYLNDRGMHDGVVLPGQPNGFVFEVVASPSAAREWWHAPNGCVVLMK